MMFFRNLSYLEYDELVTKLEADLAAAQSYATTLAVSMHKQHYAEDAPNWQPLPDLVGLLTQIDNMYAGLRNDLEALKVENKRLVGLPLAALTRERDEARAEAAALRADAERYRWLRNCTFDKFSGDIDDRLYVACDDAVYSNKWALHSEELDAAIDAAKEKA